MNALQSRAIRSAAALVCMTSIGAAQLAESSAPQAEAWSDADVRRAVLDELLHDKHGAARHVDARVTAGIVELIGSTPTVNGKDRAERLAGVVHGVRAVISRLQIESSRRPDGDVAREVSRALRRTAALARLAIQVRVSDGVVELDGFIDDWDEQQLAERVALSVAGTRFCQNQLVATRKAHRSARALADEVRSRLDWDLLVQHDPISVSATGTKVSLSGRVGSSVEWRRACTLGWVKGATSVECREVVVDSAEPPNGNLRHRLPNDAQVTATFKEVAAFWPSIPTTTVRVAVASGELTLSGTVPTLHDAAALQGIARCVVGVTDVKNDLRGPWWNPRIPSTSPRRRVPRGR
jgi:osmotically-inducible protein OsmY